MKKREKTREKAHPTNSEVQRIKKDIRSLRDSGKSDIEIRETLGLELRTYQKYTQILHLEDQQVWLSITQEQLGTELLRLKNTLEETYRISLAMAKDPEYEDRLGALASMNDARLNIVKLLVEYPDFIRKVSDEQGSTNTNTIKPYVKRVHS